MQSDNKVGFSTRYAPFELKSVEEAGGIGKFVGYLSVFGVQDLAGDIVERGAFTKDLRANGAERPCLWQHLWDEPIGLLRLEEDAKGLKVDGEIDLDIPEGRRAFSGIKKKYCKGMSIGYDTLVDRVVKGARYLTELKLWEGSIVTFPCLTVAQAQAKHGVATEQEIVQAISNLTMKANVAILQLRLDEWNRKLREGRVQ